MFYYIKPSSVFLKPSYTKTKVLLKPGLESSVIPPEKVQRIPVLGILNIFYTARKDFKYQKFIFLYKI